MVFISFLEGNNNNCKLNVLGREIINIMLGRQLLKKTKLKSWRWVFFFRWRFFFKQAVVNGLLCSPAKNFYFCSKLFKKKKNPTYYYMCLNALD